MEAEVVETCSEELEEAEEVKEKEEELDRLEALRQELEEAKAQAAEYLDGWQRTQADFANYKKRQEAERNELMALTNALLLRKLLPILDDFKRAAETLPHNLSGLTWIQGILLIQHKLKMLLESEGVTLIETEGASFDPRYHEAVSYEEAQGFEEGQIIGEVQRGYRLGERILRPAMVRVAKQPGPAADAPVDQST